MRSKVLAHSGGNPQWQQFWHFDRHITSKAGGSNESVEVHPLFHFHFGGNRLADVRKADESAWGKLLELSAPRIAHPPLDFVLFVDFILANFAASKWRRLLENDKDYLDAVGAAQRRFWRSYSAAVTDFFTADFVQKNGHLALQLWPALVMTRG